MLTTRHRMQNFIISNLNFKIIIFLGVLLLITMLYLEHRKPYINYDNLLVI